MYVNNLEEMLRMGITFETHITILVLEAEPQIVVKFPILGWDPTILGFKFTIQSQPY